MARDDIARHDTLTCDLPRIPSPQQWPLPVGSPRFSPHASGKTSSVLAAASASSTCLPYPPASSRWLLVNSLADSSQKVDDNATEFHSGMSNQQPGGSDAPDLPTSYTTTTSSYATHDPGDMLSTAYAPYSTSQPGDLYRTSPGVGSSSQSLPSMRTFDPVSQQRAMASGGGQAMPGQAMPFSQPQAMPQGAAHPMHMPPEGFPPYYIPMNPPYGMSPEAMVNRYNMPTDARYMGHRPGPKKEIKRRTKTGCLTCRKRRIKCDESQPTCNNCKKSKRDCAGYDPMFRQATSPSQPSPSSQTTQGSSSTAPLGLSPSPSSAQTALQIPYGASSSALPGGYPASSRQTPPSASSQLSHDSQFGAHHPQGSLRGQPGYDYYPAPDPAFRSVPPASLPDEVYSPGQRPSPEDPYQYRGGPPST